MSVSISMYAWLIFSARSHHVRFGKINTDYIYCDCIHVNLLGLALAPIPRPWIIQEVRLHIIINKQYMHYLNERDAINFRSLGGVGRCRRSYITFRFIFA